MQSAVVIISVSVITAQSFDVIVTSRRRVSQFRVSDETLNTEVSRGSFAADELTDRALTSHGFAAAANQVVTLARVTNERVV